MVGIRVDLEKDHTLYMVLSAPSEEQRLNVQV